MTPKQTRDCILRTLLDRLDSVGYVVFDFDLKPKPCLEGPDEMPWWGGYEINFKLIERQKYQILQTRPEKLRTDALVIAPNQRRTFKIDLS